jgi:hypothetical protein
MQFQNAHPELQIGADVTIKEDHMSRNIGYVSTA